MKTIKIIIAFIATIGIYILLPVNSFAQKKTIKATSLCNSSKANDSTHIISFSRAVQYISAFQDSFATLIDEPGWVEIEIGKLPKSWDKKIKAQEYHCGLLAYSCWENGRNYLAYKTAIELNDADDAYLIKPSGPFSLSSYSAPFTTEQKRNIDSTLKEMQPLATYNIITRAYYEVNTYAGKFMTRIENDVPGSMENPVGFFHFDQLTQLINQDSVQFKGIRIYWGYEDIDHEKIRIIAFAVKNSDSRNYYRNAAGRDAVILERSWPPDYQ